MANDLQRTQEWHLERKGKITASECYVLLANHKEDVPLSPEEQDEFRSEHPRAKMPETKKVDKPFSTGTLTYLNGKVAERYMPDNSFLEYVETSRYENAAMRYGTFWESDARSRYADEIGCEILDAPFVPLKGHEKFAGGSPDGIIRSGHGIIEIKCPFNPAIHLEHFLLNAPADLLAYNEQYYVQCQYNILCVEMNTEESIDYCDFISFDPRTSKTKQLKVLRIPRDDAMQQLLWHRTELAIEYMRERISLINSSQSVIK